jgi:hypothetical protein
VLPVLTTEEAVSLDQSKSAVPLPHPQVSGTGAVPRTFYLSPGQHTENILTEIGIMADEQQKLLLDGIIEMPHKSTPKL